MQINFGIANEKRCAVLPMSRFYFHLINDVDAPDDEGKELPDLEAAMQHARRHARVIAAETLKTDGKIVLSHRIDIEDEIGNVLGTVTFGDVVNIQG
jgi:hypothetical protein